MLLEFNGQHARTANYARAGLDLAPEVPNVVMLDNGLPQLAAMRWVAAYAAARLQRDE